MLALVSWSFLYTLVPRLPPTSRATPIERENLLLLLLVFGCATWLDGSLFLNQGSKSSLQWKCRILATEPPGNFREKTLLTKVPRKVGGLSLASLKHSKPITLARKEWCSHLSSLERAHSWILGMEGVFPSHMDWVEKGWLRSRKSGCCCQGRTEWMLGRQNEQTRIWLLVSWLLNYCWKWKCTGHKKRL